MSGYKTQQAALIEAIYDGLLEKTPWQTFLQELRKALDCQVSGIWFRSPFSEDASLSLRDNDAEYHQIVPIFYDQFHQQSKIFFETEKKGEVILFSEVLSKNTIKESVFYSEYLRPHNIIDGMQLFIEEPSGLSMWIELGRAKDKPLFGSPEKAFCTALVPHITRALSIYSKIKSSEIKSKISAEVIEQLSIGIVTLDREANIVDVNVIAEQLINETDGVALENNKLKLRAATDQALFRSAFDKVLSGNCDNALSATVELLRIAQYSGPDLGLLIRYAASSPWYEGRGCPAVVVYLCAPNVQRNTREAFVAKLFGLTISEATMAILLAEGVTISQAAKQLSLTENSARTVSKRIFAKTGARRQAELVRLILSSVAILG